MRLHQLYRTQKLPISVEEAWDFLSDPKNLQTITPDNMKFEILSGTADKMYQGQIIEYNVTPFMGIKTSWVTEITHVNEPHYFVDEQRFGPYKLWHHKHIIKPIDGGVLMEDLVHYKLPMGIVGTWMEPFLVKPKLEKIFNYREEKLKSLFGKMH
ncbi:SRPBCC family protein [Aegicerativicinus sediminis]|uniref:SRPBCC family protein n=1 Tax=Aegicerativicinus sediminis TaxID=2893202 RepID=UPI001E53627E|nr:SRPBCC family protein [Aegicerativicinus sediminis]